MNGAAAKVSSRSATCEEIQDWLLLRLAAVLDADPQRIELREPFHHHGLDSLKATRLCAELAVWLGRPLSPTLLFEHPTVEALARSLADDAPQERAVEVEQTRGLGTEPIAIVGVACRFPGAANPESFWTLLREGVDAVTAVPPERWERDGSSGPDQAAPGKTSSRWGGFLPQVDTFDAGFFGIAPREAIQIDPQQRLALELSWEALEDAGLPPATLRGRPVSVFVGVIWHDYADVHLSTHAPIELHTGTGQAHSIVANRISYTLGLTGPSMAIDCACSSSLVAVHQACQSLRLGESSLALAGGVNLMLSAHTSQLLVEFGGLSPRGRCRAFDAGADGFVRGEGGGFVVLKPLSRALADGDRIYCVIRGSSVNNDGASNGLTAPNPAAQRAVLADACARAGVAPGAVHYVETHGTGTKLGDPIEAGALGAILSQGRDPATPLLVGSVKTNIGHLEGAAGIAGLIKTALAIAHRQVPPSLHFDQPNPLIALSDLRLRVVTELEPWPSAAVPLAGVSSFGWGGTNCHVVLGGLDAAPARLFACAAEDEASLRAGAEAAAASCSSPPSAGPCGAASGQGPHRLAVAFRSERELAACMRAWLDGDAEHGCQVGVARPGRRRTTFVFSPQGGQWRGMATELLRVNDAFRRKIEACDAAIARLAGWSLFDELRAPGPRSARADFVQPTLFAVQVALAAALEAGGLHPDFVVGHSLGEISAAHVAGALCLDDAARVIVHYSRLQATTADGAMALVELSAERAAALVAPFHGAVCVAGHNGPTTTVLSGRPAALDEILAELSAHGGYGARIDVDVAAHSAQMDPILDEIRAALAAIQPQPCRVPMWATSIEGPVDGRALDGAWFARNIRQPVRFHEACSALAAHGVDVFVEVNPHPILLRALRQGLQAINPDALIVGTLIRGEPESDALLHTLARLWIAGVELHAGQGAIGDDSTGRAVLVPLSAKSPQALAAVATQLAAHLEAHPELQLHDVAFSLATTRDAMDHRLAVAATSPKGLRAALLAAAQGEMPPGVGFGSTAAARGKVAFVFTGQGAQVPGMGRGLYAAYPVFREAFAACLALFDRELDRPLRELMWAPPGSDAAALLDLTAYTQPALFALEYALCTLWRSWGVEPQFVVGHSIGEVVAACVAGVFSLADAARLVAARGRLMQALPAGGAMVSLAASEDEVAAAVARHASQVSIAAVNGPQQVVIAGAEAPVQEIAAAFAAHGVRTKRLRVSHAFHSPLMEPMLAAFRQVAESVTYKPPALSLVSNLSGKLCRDELTTPEYWVRHVRESVRFAAGVTALHAAGVNTFVEISPKAMLLGLLPACLPDVDPLLLASLRDGCDESVSMLEALGRFWTADGPITWSGLFPAGAQRVSLPGYPWQRERYWIKSPAHDGERAAGDPPRPAGATEAAAHDENPDSPTSSTPAGASDEGLYTFEWRRRELGVVASPAAPPPAPNTWVLLSDRGGTGAALGKLLAARGDRCIRIEPGARDAQIEPDLYVVNPADPESLRVALRRVFAGSQPPRGVLHLWSLDATLPQDTTAETLDADQALGSASVCGLLQALTRQGWRDSPRLWLVTRGAQAVGTAAGSLSVSQAPIWGLGRTISLEHPELGCSRVDVSLASVAEEALQLLQELDAKDPEQDIALRAEGRFVARLAPARSPMIPPPPARGDGSYLITGALGLPVAEQLVAMGARHIVLVDQAPPSAAAFAIASALEKQGAEVLLVQSDVSCRADVQRVLAEIDAHAPPLRGIVHTESATDPGAVLSLDAARLRRVMAPKVQGSWNLHALTLDRSLDFFVFYSSGASLLGYPDHGGEAAASAFVDALACQRRASGLCALSINWGALAESSADRAPRERTSVPRGIGTSTPAQAAELLGQLLASERAQLAVLKLDPRQWLELYPTRAGATLLAELWRPMPRSPAKASGASRFLEKLAHARPEERPAVLEKQVREELGRTLRQDALRISPHAPFRSLGLDSLMAVELRNRLESSLGLKLPLTLLFTCTDVSSLVEHLLRDLGMPVRADKTRPAGPSDRAPEAELAAAGARTEPIAIIGMACRLPGGASTPEAYWRLLEQGVDAVSEVPAGRWDLGSPPGEGDEPAPRAARWGAFLADVDRFDAQFFGISPREAKHMDPQQRLLLEVAWEALERAGQAPDRLQGTRTGVFTGVVLTDYEKLSTAADVARDIYTVTGNGHCFLAGRLSYVLGLMGPSMTVDTACSSSLVAIHLACASLRQRESTLALAGGVNLMLSPSMSQLMAASKALSVDGRCKTFDAKANGYVRGEGCGVLVLKRLADALTDQDPILAVIRGSAVNQDGRSAGLTVPSGPAQKALLRQALENAGVSASAIGYVETHGTGTPLGDPIEVEALSEVLGAPRADGSTCALGAVKTNIGHLEAAAGVASVIKVVLALQHRAIPANLHFDTLNPRIRLEDTNFVVPTAMLPWEQLATARLAGVSSFGISGTNAHIVLEAAPTAAEREPALSGQLAAIPLSGKTPGALHALLRDTARWLADLPPDASFGLRDIAVTAGKGRAHHEHRAALVAGSLDELRRLADSAARGEANVDVVRGQAKPDERPKLVFVFPGQGSQWLGMGRDLLAEEPVFREKLERCDELIRREASWSLLDEIAAEQGRSRIHEIDVIQPALFAIGVGLAELWRSWGVEPDAVVGHSMGEVAAAHVAGALTLEDAVRIICRRSRLLRGVRGTGAMALVELPLLEARAALSGYQDRLSIAASNSPRSTVLSGDPDALEEVVGKITAQGIFCRRIKVDVASHSPQMDPLTGPLLDALAGLAPRSAAIPMYSTLSGVVLVGIELAASYWVHNLRDPVLFAPVVARLLEQGSTLFLEMSPHPILLPAIAEAVSRDGRRGVGLPSLRREVGARRVLMQSVAELYVRGYPVSWPRLHPADGRCAPLPTYPWQRERYWIERNLPPSASPGEGRPSRAPAGHPLLGTSFTIASQPGAHFWERELGSQLNPFLADHRVQGQVVLPATAYLEMALAAAMQVHGAGPHLVEQVAFDRMLVLKEEGAPTLQVVLSETEADRAFFQIFSREPRSPRWVRHAAGSLRLRSGGVIDVPASEPPGAVQKRCTVEIQAKNHYACMSARALEYGPYFQGVEHLWLGPNEVLGRVHAPAEIALQASAYQIHPALLDACFQVMGALFLAQDAMRGGDEPIVPVGAESFQLHRQPGSQVWAHGRLRSDPQAEGLIGDLILRDDDGQVIAAVRGLRAQQLASTARPGRRPYEDWLYGLDWRRQEHLPEPPENSAAPLPGGWVVLADRRGVGLALASQLRRRGESCVAVIAGKRYTQLEPDLYEVDAADPASFDALCDNLFGKAVVCRRVVHLWSLDAAAADATTAELLETALQLGSLSALHLVQAIIAKRWRDMPGLWLVTCGAQRALADEVPLNVAQSPLWGFARSLAMEHPELACKSVDLSPTYSPSEAAQALLREMLARPKDDQIALRPSGRYIASLIRESINPSDTSAGGARTAARSPLRTDGTYLIAGGLGGLGLNLAQWLVAKGVRHLVLLGRRVPSESAALAITAMQAQGAEVRALQTDVAQVEDVRRVLLEIKQSMPALRGVVHAAMVLDDRTVMKLDAARFCRVTAPKVQGAWNLHLMTTTLLDEPLDFFVMYSSAAALLGSPGQAHYAAANAFLTALAHHRRSLGLSALSIDWGLFSDVGIMASRDTEGERLSYRGITALTPAQGLEVFERLLGSDTPHIGVLRLNLRQWLQFYPSAAGASIFQVLRAEGDRNHSVSPSIPRFKGTLEHASPGERRLLLENHVCEQLGQVIHEDASRIDRSAAFGSLGVDSLMGLEYRNRLESSLGVPLSVSLLFAYPTPSALAEHLLHRMELAEESEKSVAPGPGELAEMDAQLDVEEVLALIDQSLDRLENRKNLRE